MINKNMSSKKFIELISIIEKLRSDSGCDWDKKQTAESLIPYLLEETYELIEAIGNNDIDTIKEELGDLVLHILFQAQIANEKKQFNIEDSLQNICDKLIKRHPHVFNGQKKKSSNWEFEKQKEKKRNSLLDGVPKTLPALIRANRIQEKASSVGFDWKKINQAWKKFYEELDELKVACNTNNINYIEQELGDLLFSIVNLSRFLNINSELALKKTIEKFENRFTYIEKGLFKKGTNVNDASLDEMDLLWEESKKK